MVLAITSMMSVLLIDGVSQVLTIEQRMSVRTREFRSAELRQYWFRQVFAGAQASNDVRFQMSPSSIRGLTLTPLVSEQGLPTPFELSLASVDGVTELRYQEREGAQFTLMSLDESELSTPARFLVVNPNGTYARGWQSNPDGPQWPSGIALSMPWRDGELMWHVAILGKRVPPPDIEAMME